MTEEFPGQQKKKNLIRVIRKHPIALTSKALKFLVIFYSCHYSDRRGEQGHQLFSRIILILLPGTSSCFAFICLLLMVDLVL
jgi:hypothetical protein